MLPLLRTRRLILRPLRPADAPAMQGFAEDIDVARMLTRVPHPYPPGEAAGFIAEFAGPRAAGMPVRPFAVELEERFAGVVAFSDEDGFKGGPLVLGYWLGRPFWGRGVATEAARTLLQRYAFGTLGVDQVLAGAFADNPASLRVLAKLGFERLEISELYSLARGCAASHVDMRLTQACFEGRTP